MRVFIFAVSIMMSLCGCGSGLKIVNICETADCPYRDPYAGGMNGAENLAFDGDGFLFVTGLDGMIYKIAPTDNIYRGEIVDKKKLGTMCLGIEIGPDKNVYVGVQDDNKNRRIARIPRDFSDPVFLTDPVPGLNGLTQDKRGYLYYTSSDEKMIAPSGKIFRVKFGADGNFKNPEAVVDRTGMVNGLAFSSDESTLYYTETMNGVWAFDITTKEKRRIYAPGGFFQVVDDLCAGEDGALWLCFNSELCIAPIKNEKASACYLVGDLKAPSSCSFGRGRGFRNDCLYITEFGLKGRSFTMNGRGVWIFPVKEIIKAE